MVRMNAEVNNDVHVFLGKQKMTVSKSPIVIRRH